MSDGKVVFDITGDLSGINSALDSATSKISKDTGKWTALAQTAMNAMVSAAKTGFGFVKTMAKNSFDYNVKMQNYQTNFATMLGSTEAAQKKIAELREYAAKTPFTMDDLAGATQTLLTFGVSSDEASVALKHLGDISLGDANRLNSLALAFGQVSSAGKMSGQDLLQMINAGFNPLQVIAEKTGAAYSDLRAVMSGEKTSDDFALRMEAARKEVEELGANASESAILLTQIGDDGSISAKTVAAAMRIATSEGGRFHNALLNASKTAQGQMSTISDQWDTLIGNVGAGVFNALSEKAFPKVIEWLDKLNTAYAENGFEGLKGAAGGIFDEIAGLAFNIGAEIITQLYNGITGNKATTEEVKKYLTEIFGAASDAVETIKGAGTDFLAWIKDNGEAVGAAATAIGVGFSIFMVFTHPLSAGLIALGAAIIAFTTDWATFEAKYPTIVAGFEKLTGIDFSSFASGAESAKNNLSAFYNDALKPVIDYLLANGDAFQGVLFAIGAVMTIFGGFGGKLVGISLMLGVVSTNWTKIKTAVSDAIDKVDEFFSKTVPESWNKFCIQVKEAWKEHVTDKIDEAANKVLEFFGIEVPEGWSFCESLAAPWKNLMKLIQDTIDLVYQFLGIKTKKDLISELPYDVSAWSDSAQDAALEFMTYFPEFSSGNMKNYGKMQEALDKITEEQGTKETQAFMRAAQDKYRQQTEEARRNEEIASMPVDDRIPARYGDLDPATKAELKKYAEMALKKGITGAMMGLDVNTPVPDDVLQSFTADLIEAIEAGELTIENIDAWFGDAQGQLQEQLDGTSLTVGVTPHLNLRLLGSLSGLLGGLSGTNHAAGGLFTSATRMMGEDGMHTFGESGTEAILPLDTLWRKMGYLLDSSLSDSLASLQFTVLPQLPAASPSPPQDDDLPGKVAKAVREAVSDITLEMDKRTVGRIVAPVVSREMADSYNERMWTS